MTGLSLSLALSGFLRAEQTLSQGWFPSRATSLSLHLPIPQGTAPPLRGFSSCSRAGAWTPAGRFRNSEGWFPSPSASGYLQKQGLGRQAAAKAVLTIETRL